VKKNMGEFIMGLHIKGVNVFITEEGWEEIAKLLGEGKIIMLDMEKAV